MDELYRKLLAQLEEGQDTVLAFITEGDGSIPRTTGAYMLVGREGRIFGTIGGGNLEYQAVLHAQELVQEKKSEYREYDLGTGEGKGLGMVCGGRVKVCFYFMNGAHGEAESLAQALAAPLSTFEPSAVSWEACLARILKVVDLLEGGSYG